MAKAYASAAVLLLAGAFGASGTVYEMEQAARRIHHDEALWQTGWTATEVSVDKVAGYRGRSLFVHRYSVQVAYKDHTGRARSARVHFNTLATTFDQSAPLVVRYDPRHPDQIVLSWAIDLTGARWGAVVFLGALGGLFGLAFLVSGFVQLRILGHARSVAESFDKVEVPLTRKVEIKQRGKRTGRVRYQYEIARADGRTGRGSVIFDLEKHQAPIFIHPHRMLALRTPRRPNRVIVLRNDYYPFQAPRPLGAAAPSPPERATASKPA